MSPSMAVHVSHPVAFGDHESPGTHLVARISIK